MRYTRLIVTAIDRYWLEAGLQSFCGYATSVIACDAEVGIENALDESQTPDGRPGASVLAFAFDAERLQKAVTNRLSQCLLTCPTTAVFSGLESEQQIELGNHIRYFGDGYQKSKIIGDRRYWRIPVMDGEFVVEDTVGVAKGVAGGNLLIQTNHQLTGLHAAKNAVQSIAKLPNVITPFPGGVVRSGSKVGSRYQGLVASTSHTYCPALKGRTDTDLQEDATCVYEIVIDGTDFDAVESAMKSGIEAAEGDGVLQIGAGNYGGNLGKHHFYLHGLFENLKK